MTTRYLPSLSTGQAVREELDYVHDDIDGVIRKVLVRESLPISDFCVMKDAYCFELLAYIRQRHKCQLALLSSLLRENEARERELKTLLAAAQNVDATRQISLSAHRSHNSVSIQVQNKLFQAKERLESVAREVQSYQVAGHSR